MSSCGWSHEREREVTTQPEGDTRLSQVTLCIQLKLIETNYIENVDNNETRS